MSDGALLRYYSRRAGEYERIYQKPERQADLAALREHLQRVLANRRVLEIACGSGYWTAAIATSAEWILATDASQEVLAIARAKRLDASRVSFALADAWDLTQLPCAFNAGMANFWWSHVPRKELAGFLGRFHAALLPGAKIVFVDNRFVEGSNTPIHRTDSDGNTYQVRSLEDGSSHEVLKNFPKEDELHEILTPFADQLEVTLFKHFWCATYCSRPIPST